MEKLIPLENPQEAARAVVQMSQGAGWKILAARLERHLANSRREVSQRLRDGKYSEAGVLQGRVDGVTWVLEEAQRLCKVSEPKDNPRY